MADGKLHKYWRQKPNMYIYPLLADLEDEDYRNESFTIEEVFSDTIVLLIKESNHYFRGKKFLVSITINNRTNGLPVVQIEPIIFHPHVDEVTGYLRYNTKHWTPSLKLSEMVDAIQLLLSIDEDIEDTEECANPIAAFYVKYDTQTYREMIANTQLWDNFGKPKKRSSNPEEALPPEKRIKCPEEDYIIDCANEDENEEDGDPQNLASDTTNDLEVNDFVAELLHHQEKVESENTQLRIREAENQRLIQEIIQNITSIFESHV